MPTIASIRKDLRLFAKYHLKHPVEAYPAREEELGLVELPFDLDAYVRELEGFDGDRFTVTREAELAYEGRRHPMVTLRSRAKAHATLLLIVGIHGNERAGLLALPNILERFDPELGVRLVVIAPANPVGASKLSRYNGRGYDINRDFKRFETEEARAIRAVYERERPDFVVSLHEGPQDATFMFANHHVPSAIARRALEALAAGGATLATRDYFGLPLNPPGLSASTRVGRIVNRVWAAVPGMMATIQYSADRSIPELVLESSWREREAAARIRPHVDLVDAILRALGK